ncbi:MAG: phosphosulfolactate synthase [Candidatus Aminicenantes bacterium]|nr:MAG: phosphosulfolactate synthase [Candidatus Aminicenantes bacterium]
MTKAWEGITEMPVQGRSSKPRTTGLTMVIDKGIGMNQVTDLVQTSGEFIDIIKLTFGTSAFYNREFLMEKIRLLAAADIDVMPGGTFLEVALWKGAYEKYLEKAKELGFSTIEISDGTIEIDLATRKKIIRQALDMDFKVITEVGKKDPKEALPIALVHQMIREDLECGALKVIIEAREAGKGVGIFDHTGKIKQDEVDNIIAGVEDIDLLVWEAPIKNQQQELILQFGNNVNLGNVPADEVLALEALRQGLRGDTLKRAYLANKQ